MQLIRGQHNFDRHIGQCYATIGTFDGLHLGHQAVLKRLQERARAANLPSVVILFEPHPMEFLNPEKALPRLTRFRDKLIRLRELNIDKVVCLRFNRELASLSAESFIEEILVKALRIQHLVVGDDFHFGSDRKGNYQLLEAWGQRAGFSVEPTLTYSYHGERVSSTKIRTAIANNDFTLAEQLLGRPFSLCGRVHHGDKRGRSIGFPTLNLPMPHAMAVQGVYAVKVKGLGAESIAGVANIGIRPTVNGFRRLLEVYLLDFQGDCYGKNIEVIFCQRLRQEQKFPSLVALREQIAQDVSDARRYFDMRV